MNRAVRGKLALIQSFWETGRRACLALAALFAGAVALWVLAVVLTTLVAALVLSVISVVWILWKVPQYQVSSLADTIPDPGRIKELENEHRKTLVQLLGGIVVLGGLFFTWEQLSASRQQVSITSRQIEILQEGQVTERYTKAIEQLGSDKEAVRLGGIYALGRIAKDSPRDNRTVVEVLSALARQASPTRLMANRPTIDVYGALSTIAAISKGIQGIDLSNVYAPNSDIAGAFLEDAKLNSSVFSDSDFTEAVFGGANLSGSEFDEARFDRANLRGADLRAADFSHAKFRGADLTGVDVKYLEFRAADFTGAMLVGTDFRYANLQSAIFVNSNLRRANLRSSQKYVLRSGYPGFETTAQVLTRTHRQDANLKHAKFEGAQLDGADIRGVDLSTAVGLAVKQVESSYWDSTTSFPSYLAAQLPVKRLPSDCAQHDVGIGKVRVFSEGKIRIPIEFLGSYNFIELEIMARSSKSPTANKVISEPGDSPVEFDFDLPSNERFTVLLSAGGDCEAIEQEAIGSIGVTGMSGE